MGLMDGLMKGLKAAAESIDEKAGLSGESSLGGLAKMAEQTLNQALGNTDEQTAGQTEKNETEQEDTAVEPIKLSGSYYVVENEFVSYEVPEEFEEYYSHAAEIDLSYRYGSDDRAPFICLQDVGYLPAKKPIDKGVFKYSSGGWVRDRSANVFYYGFTTKQGYEFLLNAVVYTEDRATRLMLEQVLEHAADTLVVKL